MRKLQEEKEEKDQLDEKKRELKRNAPLPRPRRSRQKEAFRRVEVLQPLVVLQHLNELFRLLPARKRRQPPSFFLLFR